METLRKSLVMAVFAALVLLLGGCKSSGKAKPAPELPQPRSTPVAESTPAPDEATSVAQEPGITTSQISSDSVGSGELPADIETLNAKGYIKDAYFESDKSELRDDTRELLASDASWLKQYPTIKVLIEGHCDERNTADYNLALGWRRANAVRDYLVTLGVSGDRLSVISYGEERPFALGHDEASWTQNRRVHFRITGR
jgi:peptidoglycan-associated lipoprotein